mmetsp:Transcript_3290/g.7287  ORF Transcript_3290/g.7287 Transcript_3290/m.7287 type:complete len:450 (+) Transcript_3290:92-1441(+)
MKCSAAASIVLVLNHGAHAFVFPSSPLPSSSRTPAASAPLHASSTSTDPYASMLDAISSAVDAANSAAQTSAQLASSLPTSNSVAAFIAPDAMSMTQAKLSILESNIAISSDPAVMSKAIIDALDASIHAAEHTVASTSVLVSNLAHFDEVFSNSMAMHSYHLLPLETADLAQSNLATLIHNLGGIGVDDNAFFKNFLANVDRKLDDLPMSTSNIMMYVTLTLFLAYSQRQAGVRMYKKELRKMLEEGVLDIDVLAQDVGLFVKATAPYSNDAHLEDPALAMAVIVAKEELAVTQNEKEEVVRDAEALLATAAEVLTENSAPAATPKPPAEDIPMVTLMKAAASENVMAAVEPATKPENVMMVEFSTNKEEAKVNVVQKKKRTAPKKNVAVRPNRPAASPLARLLAEELGLDLIFLGNGEFMQDPYCFLYMFFLAPITLVVLSVHILFE